MWLIMNKKKLQLEIIDPAGQVVRTHHFFYEPDENDRIRVTIDGKSFFWEDNKTQLFYDGKPVVETSQEGLNKPKYFNPETQKTQRLFCEEVLIPVWNVRYEDPNVGNKGEAVYYTVSAKDEKDAKTQALACTDFNKHILPEHYNARYLTVYKPVGNYKIGEVRYFEGDPRL
jgi:hypothetical protein